MKPTHDTRRWQDAVTSEHWIAYRFDHTARLYEVEVFVKVDTPTTGIKHLLRWTHVIDEQELVAECLQQGTFSARPYTLGQGGDSTIGACIDALYTHMCESKHLDPQALYVRAYPRPSDLEIDSPVIRHLAEWQGVIYPNIWDKQEVLHLLDDLASMNNHALVTVLCETLPSLNLFME